MPEAAVKLNDQGYPESWDIGFEGNAPALHLIHGNKSTEPRPVSDSGKEWHTRVAEIMIDRGDLETAIKFEQCGREWIGLKCDECGNRRLVRVGCDLRICPECAHKFAVKSAMQIKEAWRHVERRLGWSLKHITLTMKTDGDLRGAYDRGFKAIPKLWRKHLKREGAGMVCCAEFGPKNGNCHFHIVYYGPFVLQADLSRWWLELTGDSQVVYIQYIRDRGRGMDRAFFEALKYPAKFSDLTPEQAVDVLEALKGTRRIRTYGCFYGKIKSKVEVPCPECGGTDWTVVDRGPSEEVQERYEKWKEQWDERKAAERLKGAQRPLGEQ